METVLETSATNNEEGSTAAILSFFRDQHLHVNSQSTFTTPIASDCFSAGEEKVVHQSNRGVLDPPIGANGLGFILMMVRTIKSLEPSFAIKTFNELLGKEGSTLEIISQNEETRTASNDSEQHDDSETEVRSASPSNS